MPAGQARQASVASTAGGDLGQGNAHRFGFIVRYPDGAEYRLLYEPWHLRFIGAKAATDMSARGIGTLEQYFGLEAAPAYR